MRNANAGTDDRGNLERMGESAGAMAGRAAEFGMEVTGAMFRSAAEMLGGWWSSEAPRQAADGWKQSAERDCRSHFEATASGSTNAGRTDTDSPAVEGAGGTQATHAAPKSGRAAMQADLGDGSVGVEGAARFDSDTDGFERAKPGYQLGYVARQNPAYRDRSFNEVEPELKRVWESRAKTESGGSASTSSWPEVRGFVDFAYQQGDERR